MNSDSETPTRPEVAFKTAMPGFVSRNKVRAEQYDLALAWMASAVHIEDYQRQLLTSPSVSP